MSTLIHADIFFFITSIAVVIFTIFAIIIGIYLSIILNDVRIISRKVRNESDKIIDDLHELRLELKSEVKGYKRLFIFFKHMFGTKKKSHKSE